MPLEYWFKGGLRTYGHDSLFDPRTRGRSIFQASAVERLVQQYENGRGELAATIWMLLVLEIWYRLYLEGVHRI